MSTVDTPRPRRTARLIPRLTLPRALYKPVKLGSYACYFRLGGSLVKPIQHTLTLLCCGVFYSQGVGEDAYSTLKLGVGAVFIAGL